MSDISQAQYASGGQPHYSIYAYDKFIEGEIGANKWILLQSDDNKTRILDKAKKIYSTHKYDKIEVKKKLFDTKSNRHKIQTVQVLTQKNKAENWLKIMGLTMLVCLGLFGFIQYL